MSILKLRREIAQKQSLIKWMDEVIAQVMGYGSIQEPPTMWVPIRLNKNNSTPLAQSSQ